MTTIDDLEVAETPVPDKRTSSCRGPLATRVAVTQVLQDGGSCWRGRGGGGGSSPRRRSDSKMTRAKDD